jgi:tetratricopeptide (TPR) repeat protein
MLALSVPCFAADSSMTGRSNAERALMLGRADEATTILNQLIAADPKDAAAHLLLCRAFYTEEIPDKAVSECEAALANGLSGNSVAQDWMGRAYGKKADSSGPFGGLSLAKKVKIAFEAAVQLDPNNGPAVNDLSEYYVGAPGFVGGGVDKATALAAQVEAHLPQPAHRIRALAAEKKGDYDIAEREFRAAVGVAGHADAWADLGDFYGRRKQKDQAVAALRKALEADTAKDASLVDVASILDDIHREPQLAAHALRDYLASDSKSDAAPAFKAHYLLGKLLSAAGNKAAAQSEYRAALALASNYAPARKALRAQ